MNYFAWYDWKCGMWFAVDTKTEKCYGGFQSEQDAEKWIIKNGYKLS